MSDEGPVTTCPSECGPGIEPAISVVPPTMDGAIRDRDDPRLPGRAHPVAPAVPGTLHVAWTADGGEYVSEITILDGSADGLRRRAVVTTRHGEDAVTHAATAFRDAHGSLHLDAREGEITRRTWGTAWSPDSFAIDAYGQVRTADDLVQQGAGWVVPAPARPMRITDTEASPMRTPVTCGLQGVPEDAIADTGTVVPEPPSVDEVLVDPLAGIGAALPPGVEPSTPRLEPCGCGHLIGEHDVGGSASRPGACRLCIIPIPDGCLYVSAQMAASPSPAPIPIPVMRP